ncbi:MAG TPA: hypothetical protein VIN03_02945 [Roseateles sp.]
MFDALFAIDPKLLAALGAVGSAMLAAAGYIAKLRYERKRTLRVTLFYLLQLRHSAVVDELIATQLPERVIKALNEALGDQKLDLTDAETESLVREARPILAAVAERQSAAELQEIRGQLAKSLSDLAKDEPVLAFRLSAGLPNLKLPDGASDVRPADFPPQAATIATSIATSIRTGFHAEGARLLQQKLSGLIHMASLEIGILSFFATYLLLRRQDRTKLPDSFFEAISKPMAAVTKELVSTLETTAAPEVLPAEAGNGTPALHSSGQPSAAQ